MKLNTQAKVLLTIAVFGIAFIGFIIRLPHQFHNYDKELHTLFYFLAAAFLNILFAKRKIILHIIIFIFLALFGVAIEYAQHYANRFLPGNPHGQPDIADVEANIKGLIIFSILWIAYLLITRGSTKSNNYSSLNLQTSRLHLRQVLKTDLKDIHELLSLPETDRFNTLGIPETIQEIEKIINDWCINQNANLPTSYIFCVDLLDTKNFIGLIGLNIGKPKYKTAEVWYKIHPAQWNKGYATEALSKLIEFGFNELGLHRIEAGCAVENMASVKVLEKVGMKREGLKRKILPIRGEWKDNYFYAILEEDFLGVK